MMRVLFSKISDNRSKEFSVKTSIVSDGGRRYVIKEAVFPEGKAHIERVFQNREILTRAFPNVNISKTWLEKDRLYGEFIDGVLLSEYYMKFVNMGDRQKIFDLFDWQIGLLTNHDNICEFTVSDEFVKWFDYNDETLVGVSALKVSNFDATHENIFILNDYFGEPCFIDHEWCFDFPIPLFLIKYHMIDMMYLWINDLKDLISGDEFLLRHLNQSEISLCEKLWYNFSTGLNRYSDGITPAEREARYLKKNETVDRGHLTLFYRNTHPCVKETKLRVAVFMFYDDEGIADDYIDYYLCEFTKHVARVIVVCNGVITDSAKALFEKYSNELIIRENIGHDVWAYRAGLEHVGWEILHVYDEVILANYTVFGPIFPFKELFDSMSEKQLDFWGITKHEKLIDNVVPGNPFGYIPAHIQSYFTVFGKRLVSSRDFRGYWENIPNIRSREDSIGKHETYITKYFADKGYHWDVYAKTNEFGDMFSDSTFSRPLSLLNKQRVPIIKCKLFVTDRLCENTGEQASAVFEYLKTQTSYDVRLIMQAIIRKYHQYDFVKNMALTYVLSTQLKLMADLDPSTKQRVALIMHLFYSDMLDEAFHYAQSMPKGSDIFITTDEQNKVDNISDLLRKEDYCVEIRIVKNRGRSESALLVGMADAVGRYDLICFWKEKKSGHIDPVGAAQGWWYKISENLLHSKVFVENIIATFSDNRQLGMLSPTPPNHSKLYAIMGREWDDDYENAVLLAERLNLHVPMSEKKPPICPLGGSFWFRPAALRKLFEYGWSYDDFPTEPIATGGTLLHALERIYPFVAQDAGYCPAYVLSDRFASIEYTNLSHYLRSSNLLAKRWGVDHLNYIATIDEMDRMLAINGTASQSLKTHIKQYMKTRFPRPIFLIVLGLKRLVFGPDRKNCVLDAMRHFHKNP